MIEHRISSVSSDARPYGHHTGITPMSDRLEEPSFIAGFGIFLETALLPGKFETAARLEQCSNPALYNDG